MASVGTFSTVLEVSHARARSQVRQMGLDEVTARVIDPETDASQVSLHDFFGRKNVTQRSPQLRSARLSNSRSALMSRCNLAQV